MLPGASHTAKALRPRAALLFALLLCAPQVHADITLLGGSSAQRDRIAVLLGARWLPSQMASVDLTITLDVASLERYCASDATQPVLALYVYQSQFLQAIAQCEPTVEAILTDPPVAHLTRLAKGLFPGVRTAMLGNARGEIAPGTALSDLADTVLPVPDEGVARGLGRLIAANRWRVFILPVDEAVYQATDYRLVIETLLRQRRPTVVSIPSLLPQGAAAAAYYSSNEIETALVSVIDALMETGELVGRRPEKVSVAINEAVMKNFFGRVVSEQERRALEKVVNDG